MTNSQKRCSKCGQTKDLSEFYAQELKSGEGHMPECGACKREYRRKWYLANREKAKEDARKRYLANQERGKESSRSYAAANREKVKGRHRAWRAANAEKLREYNREWRAANPEKTKEIHARQGQKRHSTGRGRLNGGISSGIRISLKGEKKGGRHWETLVDFTVEQLMKHLAKRFLPGMSWGNYGEWHVDHKVPISAFNFETPEDIDFKRCWCLKNLQPLWAMENLQKHNKLDKPFQPALGLPR